MDLAWIHDLLTFIHWCITNPTGRRRLEKKKVVPTIQLLDFSWKFSVGKNCLEHVRGIGICRPESGCLVTDSATSHWLSHWLGHLPRLDSLTYPLFPLPPPSPHSFLTIGARTTDRQYHHYHINCKLVGPGSSAGPGAIMIHKHNYPLDWYEASPFELRNNPSASSSSNG